MYYATSFDAVHALNDVDSNSFDAGIAPKSRTRHFLCVNVFSTSIDAGKYSNEFFHAKSASMMLKQHQLMRESPLCSVRIIIILTRNLCMIYENMEQLMEKSKADFSESYLNKIGTDMHFKRKIVWFNAIGFLLLMITGFIGILAAIFGFCHWQTTLWSLLLAYGAGIGVTMGAHRHFTHRAFKVVPWFRVVLLLLHTIAGQNCLWVWVRDHRQHHKFSDTDADPHNATRGFFFSHVGWLMSKKHPKVIQYGKTIDMTDIESDKLIMFQKRHYKVLYTIFALVIPSFVPLLWGENIFMSFLVSYFGRTAINLNVTWLVNSAAHLYGMRPYNKYITPVESIFVSLLTVGEGWHNYHHVFPWDYRASELGMPFNVTCKLIDGLANLGIVYDLRQASTNMINYSVKNKGDGSHISNHGQTCRTWSDVKTMWIESLNIPYLFKYFQCLVEGKSQLKDCHNVANKHFN